MGVIKAQPFHERSDYKLYDKQYVKINSCHRYAVERGFHYKIFRRRCSKRVSLRPIEGTDNSDAFIEKE